MTRRLAIAGGIAIAALAVVLAIASAWGAFDPPVTPADIRPAPIGPAHWKETRRYTVNRVMIVEGESTHPERAVELARTLLEAEADRYDEVLIYVRRPGDRSRTWRVQWTKADGFRVLEY